MTSFNILKHFQRKPLAWSITLYLISGLLAASSTFAHHGTFTYDGNTILTLEGQISQFNWTNPHSSIHLNVTDGNGDVQQYILEGDGPSLLSPLGVDRNSLEVGDRVIAFVSPSTRETVTGASKLVLGREVLKEDGSVVSLSVRYARRDNRSRSPVTDRVIGTWVPDLNALFNFVDDRGEWVLTPKGSESLQSYDTSAPFSHAQCIAATAPTLMVYPTAKTISEQGNTLELNVDWMGAIRTVYMDGREHPASNERFSQGHSTGQWEGNQLLIIDTTNFTNNPIGNAFGVPSGINKHLIERFSLSDDGRSLSYSFILEDSEYLLETARGSYQWHHRPDVKASSLECDLESAARYLNE